MRAFLVGAFEFLDNRVGLAALQQGAGILSTPINYDTFLGSMQPQARWPITCTRIGVG